MTYYTNIIYLYSMSYIINIHNFFTYMCFRCTQARKNFAKSFTLWNIALKSASMRLYLKNHKIYMSVYILLFFTQSSSWRSSSYARRAASATSCRPSAYRTPVSLLGTCPSTPASWYAWTCCRSWDAASFLASHHPRPNMRSPSPSRWTW